MVEKNATTGGGAGDKIVGGIDEVTKVIGTLVPTVAALGGLIRLIATAVRPSDVQKGQAFDAAIAEYDKAKAGLDTSISGFEAAKAAAQDVQGVAKQPAEGKPVTAMKAGTKPSDG